MLSCTCNHVYSIIFVVFSWSEASHKPHPHTKEREYRLAWVPGGVDNWGHLRLSATVRGSVYWKQRAAEPLYAWSFEFSPLRPNLERFKYKHVHDLKSFWIFMSGTGLFICYRLYTLSECVWWESWETLSMLVSSWLKTFSPRYPLYSTLPKHPFI